MDIELDVDLPEFTPLDKERIKFFEQRLKECKKVQPNLPKVRQRLLEIGGLEIVPQGAKDWYNLQLLKHGVAVVPDKVKLVKGLPSQCHLNSSALWLEQEDYKLHTGYALSDDGLWRQHTWVSHKEKIIETTEVRLLYYGTTLDDATSIYFACSNLQEDVLKVEIAEKWLKMMHDMPKLVKKMDQGIFV